MKKKKVNKPLSKIVPGGEAPYYPPEWVLPELDQEPEESKNDGS